jgi:hypothetical protein
LAAEHFIYRTSLKLLGLQFDKFSNQEVPSHLFSNFIPKDILQILIYIGLEIINETGLISGALEN